MTVVPVPAQFLPAELGVLHQVVGRLGVEHLRQLGIEDPDQVWADLQSAMERLSQLAGRLRIGRPLPLVPVQAAEDAVLGVPMPVPMSARTCQLLEVAARRRNVPALVMASELAAGLEGVFGQLAEAWLGNEIERIAEEAMPAVPEPDAGAPSVAEMGATPGRSTERLDKERRVLSLMEVPGLAGEIFGQVLTAAEVAAMDDASLNRALEALNEGMAGK